MRALQRATGKIKQKQKAGETHQPTPKAAPLRTGAFAAAAPVAAGFAAGAAATAGKGLAAGRDWADTGPASIVCQKIIRMPG